MPLTPLDIRKKEFGTQLRGLSPKEVQSFLEMVAKEMEQLRKERALLAEQVDELRGRLEQHERTEDLLKETLVTAQKTTAEMRTTAQEQAKVVLDKAEQERQELIRQAKQEREELIRQAEQDAEKLRSELVRLASERENLLGQVRAIAGSYLSMTEKWEAGHPKDGPEAAD